MYGISVYNVPIVNKYVFNFYCEDKEVLESFMQAFRKFINDDGGTIEIKNDSE